MTNRRCGSVRGTCTAEGSTQNYFKQITATMWGQISLPSILSRTRGSFEGRWGPMLEFMYFDGRGSSQPQRLLS